MKHWAGLSRRSHECAANYTPPKTFQHYWECPRCSLGQWTRRREKSRGRRVSSFCTACCRNVLVDVPHKKGWMA